MTSKHTEDEFAEEQGMPLCLGCVLGAGDEIYL
jgi:hypothetical protein